ncbi:MAG: FeoA family protein [Kiritimatiellales bacterium]
MFDGLFRRRNRHCRRNARSGGRDQCCAHPLYDFTQGVEVHIVSNSDRKTLEMGLCTGASVRVIENRSADANMVIDAGEGRYIISKESAAKIRVR